MSAAGAGSSERLNAVIPKEYRRSLTVLGLSALSLPVATLAHVAPHQTILTDVAMHQGLYTQYSCEKMNVNIAASDSVLTVNTMHVLVATFFAHVMS